MLARGPARGVARGTLDLAKVTWAATRATWLVFFHGIPSNI